MLLENYFPMNISANAIRSGKNITPYAKTYQTYCIAELDASSISAIHI